MTNDTRINNTNGKVIPENVKAEINPSSFIGCEKCDNSGFVSIMKDGCEFRTPCDCYKNHILTKKKERCNIPEMYMEADFDIDEDVSFLRFQPDSYKTVTKTVNGEQRRVKLLQFKGRPKKYDINGFGKQYVDVSLNYLNETPRRRSVSAIFSGEVGSGKTYLACAIANAFIDKGMNVTYLKTKQYLDVIKDGFNNKELKAKRDSLNGFNKEFKDNCHLLILDELGFEYQKADSGFALAEMKDLLRNRAEKSLPTIITTNFMLDELAKVYEEELMSMFAQSYMFFFVACSDDYRLRKSKELDEGFDFDSIAK